jgi:hypothetical protein
MATTQKPRTPGLRDNDLATVRTVADLIQTHHHEVVAPHLPPPMLHQLISAAVEAHIEHRFGSRGDDESALLDFLEAHEFYNAVSDYGPVLRVLIAGEWQVFGGQTLRERIVRAMEFAGVGTADVPREEPRAEEASEQPAPESGGILDGIEVSAR